MNKIHTLVCLLFGLVIAVFALPGVANAASSKSSCPSGEESSVFCILVISAPESVVAGQPFTVKVFVTTDGTTLAKSDPCGSKALITLDVSEGESFLAEYQSRASGAVATFIIIVTNPDFYSLAAFAGEEGGSCGNTSYGSDFAEFEAISVAAGQPIAPCPPDEVCVQVTNNDAGGSSAATLFADSGDFGTPVFEAFDNQGCVNGPVDPINGVLDFTYVGTSEKTVVFALAPAVITTGIGQIGVCWESTTQFMVDGGGQAAGPNVNGYFVGYLPNCSPHIPPPCVLSKTGTQHDGAFFTVSAPPGDPKGYPGVP